MYAIVETGGKQYKLEEGRYFIEEILGVRVYDFETKEFLGVLKDVTENPANDIWHIEKDGKEYLMPAIKQFINSVDIDKEEAYIKAPRGTFDNENWYLNPFPGNV